MRCRIGRLRLEWLLMAVMYPVFGGPLVGDVTIRVVGWDGADRPYRITRFSPLKDSVRSSRTIEGLKILNVQASSYRLSLSPVDISTHGRGLCRDTSLDTILSTTARTGEIFIYQAPQRCENGSDSIRLTTRIVFENIDRTNQHWAGVTGAALNSSPAQWRLVDAQGRADFGDLVGGMYFLSLYNADGLLALIPIQVPEWHSRAGILRVDVRRWRSAKVERFEVISR